MKKKNIYWGIGVLLSFLGFRLIENTFTIDPEVVSGNGNLGILIIMLLSPIFISSYFFTFKLAREISSNAIKRISRVVILSFSIICCVLLIFLIVNYASELITALGGPPSNPDSRIYRFGWFNQYTNSIYFNVYTFLLTHIIAVIFGILSIIRMK